MLETDASRIVFARLDACRIGQRTVCDFPHRSPNSDELAVDLDDPRSVGLLGTEPDVMFTGAIDLGFDAFSHSHDGAEVYREVYKAGLPRRAWREVELR